MMDIVSREQKCDTEGSEASVLRVGLFVVADVFDQLFDGDWFGVLVLVPASAEAGLVDEDVGICG